jgi:ornithine--oxo-acid transaminase
VQSAALDVKQPDTEQTERLSAAALIALEDRFGAHNYHPLDVVIERASGAWVVDTEGRRYLDFLAAYSAVNQGHCHPAILKAMVEQAQKVTLTSRAFRNDQLPLLLRDLNAMTGFEMALPMNSGVEAVETAIKAARKWGQTVKGVPAGTGEILVCSNNFHGRTIAVVGFSSESQYKCGFGPFPTGFRQVPFGDAAAIRAAVTSRTVAILVEPVQGEAGIVVGWGGPGSCLRSSTRAFGRMCASLGRRFRVGFIRCRRCWLHGRFWGCLLRAIMAARLAGIRWRARWLGRRCR